MVLTFQCEDRGERDRLLQFLNVLLLNKSNAKRFVDANGIRCLVDLLTLAHLHTSRATVPMQVWLGLLLSSLALTMHITHD